MRCLLICTTSTSPSVALLAATHLVSCHWLLHTFCNFNGRHTLSATSLATTLPLPFHWPPFCTFSTSFALSLLCWDWARPCSLLSGSVASPGASLTPLSPALPTRPLCLIHLMAIAFSLPLKSSYNLSVCFPFFCARKYFPVVWLQVDFENLITRDRILHHCVI